MSRAQAGAGAGARPRARETIARRLRFQAGACRQLGSRLYADLLERAAQDAEAGGPTLAVLAGHEADPAPSALALRLMGGVHRLVLEGRLAERRGCDRAPTR